MVFILLLNCYFSIDNHIVYAYTCAFECAYMCFDLRGGYLNFYTDRNQNND